MSAVRRGRGAERFKKGKPWLLQALRLARGQERKNEKNGDVTSADTDRITTTDHQTHTGDSTFRNSSEEDSSTSVAVKIHTGGGDGKTAPTKGSGM